MSVVNELDEAINEHANAVGKLADMFAKLRASHDLSNDEKNKALARVYEIFPSNFISQKNISAVRANNLGASYESSICQLIRFKNQLKHQGLNLAPGSNDKLKDRAFAEALDVPVPITYSNGISFKELKLRPNSIIKPENGSSGRGVFYLNTDLSALSIKTQKLYENIEEGMAFEVPGYGEKVWIEEEAATLNGSLAADLKCFFFYGELALILEIDRMASKKQQRCWYNESGQVVENVGFKRNGFHYFKGDGFPRSVIEYGKKYHLTLQSHFYALTFSRAMKR